jgi:VanZ family protein
MSDMFRVVMIYSRVLLIILLVLMPYAALSPGTRPPSDVASHMHFYSMAFIAFVACLSFKIFQARLGAVLFVFGYSALMEFFQHILPYRNGTWDDVTTNFLGCLAGFVIFYTVYWTGQMTKHIRNYNN